MSTLNIAVKWAYKTMKDLRLEIPIDATVLDLQKEIAKCDNAPVEEQKLIYAGRWLREKSEKLKDIIVIKDDVNAVHTFHLLVQSQIPSQPQNVNQQPNFGYQHPNFPYPPNNIPYQQYPAQMGQFNQQPFPRPGFVQQPAVQPIFAFQLNFSLLLKLAFLVLILSQGGNMYRLLIVSIGAFILYLFQTARARNANIANQQRPNNGPNNVPQNNGSASAAQPNTPNTGIVRNGIIDEVRDFIFPFVFSLFPGWQPAPVGVRNW